MNNLNIEKHQTNYNNLLTDNIRLFLAILFFWIKTNWIKLHFYLKFYSFSTVF